MTQAPEQPYQVMVRASRKLAQSLKPLQFSSPVAYIYNPFMYAQGAYELYLQRYGRGTKRVIFLGMNPGPWGMAQTGVPFGEVAIVRDWLGITCPIGKPSPEHPKRPIDGFACRRSEVSGRRLWGLMAERFGTAESFFEDHFVVNYCPLSFMRDTGANITPDKLPADELRQVYERCDAHLLAVIKALKPSYLIGIGAFAHQRCEVAAQQQPGMTIGRILHPSPSNPMANRDWAGTVTQQLSEIGVW